VSVSVPVCSLFEGVCVVFPGMTELVKSSEGGDSG